MLVILLLLLLVMRRKRPEVIITYVKAVSLLEENGFYLS